jgi:hypothetical protein
VNGPDEGADRAKRSNPDADCPEPVGSPGVTDQQADDETDLGCNERE